MTFSRAVDPSEYVMSEFSCPHCQITLRSNKRLTAGRTTECPDCGESITLDRGADGRLTASPSTPADSQPSPADTTPNLRWAARLTTAKQIASNPVVVAWSVAIVGTLMLLIAIMPEDERPPPAAPRTDPVVQQPGAAGEDQQPAAGVQVANAETAAVHDTQQPSLASDARPPQPVNPPIPAPQVDPTSTPNPATNREPQPPLESIPANPAGTNPRQPATVVDNTPANKPAANQPPANKPAANQPEPVNAPVKPQPVIDIAARLEQPILEFDQAQPLELSRHMAQLEEFIGAPVRFDATLKAESPRTLEQKIGLKLSNTTVGDILSGIVSRADLAYEIRDDHILIGRKVSPKPRSE